MEKVLLKDLSCLKKAIEHFGNEYREEIINSITTYPCVLIGYYCEDIDFGNMYSFTTVTENDFKDLL
jgi:hypothetical protein